MRMPAPPILIVEDDPAILELLEEELQEAGHDTLGVGSAEEAIATLSHSEVALVISDVRLPGMSGMQLLEQLRGEGNALGFIVITAFGTIDQAVEALKIGADDFLTKPLDLEGVREAVYRVLEHRRLAARLPRDSAAGHFHGLVGDSEPMQEKCVRAVGAEQEEAVDVRIVAATHRHLEQEIERGRFRSDLFYRLETFSLRIPPLRGRNGDLERLIAALIDKHAEAQGKRIARVEPAALQALLGYPYPGNVRELENAIMRAVTLAEEGRLQHADLPERIRRHAAGQRRDNSAAVAGGLVATVTSSGDWPSLEDVEKRYIRKVLEATGGNKRRTADILGIARRTLYRRLEEEE